VQLVGDLVVAPFVAFVLCVAFHMPLTRL
jgi:hypothetical protein